MATNNTVAVLDGKDLEETIHRSFPDWRVITLTDPTKARALMRSRSVNLFMMHVDAKRLSPFRDLVREAARNLIPALFVAESQRDYTIARQEVASAPPTIQAVFGNHEVRPMVNILKDRLARAQSSDTTGSHSLLRASIAQPASDLDQHPLIQDTTRFLRNQASGRLDAKLIAQLYTEPLKRFAEALGVSPSAVTQTPDSARYQPFLARFERVARVLPMLEAKDQFSAWVKAPNRLLKGDAPADWLWSNSTKADKLAAIVEDVLVGQPD